MKLAESLVGAAVIANWPVFSDHTPGVQRVACAARMVSTAQQTNLRHRVLSPEERHLDKIFSTRRQGADARAPLNNTALRQAERKYKHGDFDDVLDFSNPETLKDARTKVKRYQNQTGLRNRGIRGVSYIPGALGEEEQVYWATMATESYINPPNPSSLDALYEFHEFDGYTQHLTNKKPLKLTRKHENRESVTLTTQEEIEAFARKLRWTTLGYQYDWTTKTYNFDPASVIPFPRDLAEWSSEFALSLGFSASEQKLA